MAVPSIAVIGAGFSGTVVAARLLRGAPGPLDLFLINRSGPFARGLAYGTRSPGHVLNVPAGRMSAFPEDENDFLRFVEARLPGATGGSFVPRELFGDYLETLLEQSGNDAGEGVRLVQVVGEVTGFEVLDTGRARLALPNHRTIDVDHVVLAIGNYPPADPSGLAGALPGDARYVRDPWAGGALLGVPAEAPVLLLGTGLTMLDVAMDLAAVGRSAPLWAVSRRGMLPEPHRSPLGRPQPWQLPSASFPAPATALELLRVFRRLVDTARREGVDWRDVMASVRPDTPRLWQSLPHREQARFLRHLRPFWESHRHRAAPVPATATAGLIGSGALTVTPGRVLSLEATSSGIAVTVRRRGAAATEQWTVGAVINCTGPSSDLRRSADPLIAALRARGLIHPDPHGLGLRTSPDHRVLAADGTPSGLIRYVGPLLRADHWEATAVPELRVHAREVAEDLLGALR